MTALDKLKERILDASGVYIPPGMDEANFISTIVDDIRSNMHEPYDISAKVVPPAFPGKKVGDLVRGQCVANRGGYWLVYDKADDVFYCFWGSDINNLTAPGIFGSPIYCWTA